MSWKREEWMWGHLGRWWVMEKVRRGEGRVVICYVITMLGFLGVYL